MAGERLELVAPERREPEERRIVGREIRRRRHVVVLQDASRRERGERVGHRRRQRVVEDRDVAGCRGGVAERPDIVPQVVVHGEGVELGLVTHGPQQIADAARAVADRIALVRRRHPLVDDHGGSAAAPDRSPGGTAAAPPAPARRRTVAQKSKVTFGRGARGRREDGIDEPQERAAEVLRPQAVDGRELAVDDPIPQRRIRQHRIHQPRHVHRILGLEQHARAVHRRRHRRGRVGEDRHLLVERLDDRHAEPFVLARAEEQIGGLVEGDQLFVRDVADEVDVRGAEGGRRVDAATQGSARTRSGRRQSAAASAG